MGKRLINVDEVEEIVPVLVGKLLENNLITEEQADQIICAIFNDNDRLNEITLAYRRIYEEEKENPGKYGIWGHRIEDLWLERMILDIETGNVKLFVGS